MTMLSDQHRAFFRIFGYLHVPGYFADEIGWITDEFTAAWSGVPAAGHDGSRRTIYPGHFIGSTPRLATLLEHPKVAAVCSALLGDGYGFHATDGNLYAGDTGWHSDAFGQWPEKTTVRHLKIAFYLDPLTRDTGALRVIPGSHWDGDGFCAALERELPEWNHDRALTMPGRDVPAVAVESAPGDLVCFDHRIKHASFGGGPRRRMFTTNWIEDARTPAMREALLAIFRFGRDHAQVDWDAPRGAWFDDPPPAREPVLRQIKEFGRLAMLELADQAPGEKLTR
jgi:hypothetical protein